MAKDIEVMRDTKYYKVGDKWVSFDYVWYKTGLLVEWLERLDIVPRWALFDAHYGTARGYEIYKGLVKQVERVCAARGIECEAMLHGGLKGVEGVDMKVSWEGGAWVAGRVERKGKYIKYYMIVRSGQTLGRKVDPWETIKLDSV